MQKGLELQSNVLKGLRNSQCCPASPRFPSSGGSSGSPMEKPSSNTCLRCPVDPRDHVWLRGLWFLPAAQQWEKSQRVWTSVKSCSTKGRGTGALFCFRLPGDHQRGKPHWQGHQLGHGRHRCLGFAGFQSKGLAPSPYLPWEAERWPRGQKKGANSERARHWASGNSLGKLSVGLGANTL